MTEEETQDIKELIKKELVRTKEDINRGVLESIKDLKKIITIEDGTGRIIILDKNKFKNMVKIEILMVGKYIAHIAEIINNPEADIQTISCELSIPKTTLSAPLGELVKKNILHKKGGQYSFNGAFMKEELQKILGVVENE